MIFHGLLLSEPDRHVERVEYPYEFADWLRDENRSRHEIETAIYGQVSPGCLAWVERQIEGHITRGDFPCLPE